MLLVSFFNNYANKCSSDNNNSKKRHTPQGAWEEIVREVKTRVAQAKRQMKTNKKTIKVNSKRNITKLQQQRDDNKLDAAHTEIK